MKILTLTPHKPITYTPGLISLLLLPAFCLMFLYQHKAFNKLTALDIAYISPDWNRGMPKAYQFRFPPERSYIDVNFSGNALSDQSLLEFARIEIKSLIRAKNKTLGIHFHFGSKAKYQTFVSAIDMCYAEDDISWIPYQDDMYVVYTKR